MATLKSFDQMKAPARQIAREIGNQAVQGALNGADSGQIAEHVVAASIKRLKEEGYSYTEEAFETFLSLVAEHGWRAAAAMTDR